MVGGSVAGGFIDSLREVNAHAPNVGPSITVRIDSKVGERSPPGPAPKAVDAQQAGEPEGQPTASLAFPPEEK